MPELMSRLEALERRALPTVAEAIEKYATCPESCPAPLRHDVMLWRRGLFQVVADGNLDLELRRLAAEGIVFSRAEAEAALADFNERFGEAVALPDAPELFADA